MIGLYPNGKPSDPETYIAAIVAVLHEYPHEIVSRVCSPVHGVARKVRFLPTIAEITDALEVEMVPHRRQWREYQLAKEAAEKRARDARALTDAQAEARVVEGFQKLSAELGAGVDPVPPTRDGTQPVGVSAGGAVAKVIADIAASKAAAREAAE